MSDDMFATSPMGGSQAPFQELQQDIQPMVQPENGQPVPSQKPASSTGISKKYVIIFGIAMGFIVIFLIMLLVMVTQKEAPVIIQPAPTPTLAPKIEEKSSLPQHIEDQVNQLEVNIDEADLQELDLTYPQVDWLIKYEAN